MWALENNFLVSIAYHSSRSGCLSEKVKYPWVWEDDKFTPDHSVVSKLGEEIAGFIETVSGAGNGYYEPSPSGSFKGVAHNWFYSKTGCLQYLIEVAEGDEGMQPDEDYLINSILQNNLKGAFYAINRTAGLNLGTLGAEKNMITGLVSDLSTGEVLEGAFVKILEMDGGVLSPRLTDSFGRYRRLLIDETYTLEVSALGYETQEYQFSPSANEITTKDFSLMPIPEATLLINVDSTILVFELSLVSTPILFPSSLDEMFKTSEFSPTETALSPEFVINVSLIFTFDVIESMPSFAELSILHLLIEIVVISISIASANALLMLQLTILTFEL